MQRKFTWPLLLTPHGRGLAFGGDYNPDQWSEETWIEDIELMKRAGVNVVALGIFSWDRIQPQEDIWDFAWLDCIIELLGNAGIAVDLATATASAPMWLYKNYPEVLPVDKFGHTVHPGSRQSWKPTSPVFRRFALELCRKLAQRYAHNPTVTSWHVGNEYGWNNRYDYSYESEIAFQSWCERKYGTVEALNEAWGTTFWSQEVRSFDEVSVPRHMGTDAMVNPSQQLDFERFGNDMLLEFYCAERDVIAQICPDKPCTTNFMISTDQCSMDYEQWAHEVDFVSNDHYFHEGESHLDELACSDALVSSIAGGKPWYLMEHSTSAVQWKPINARKRRGELVRDSLAHVAFGADAIDFFQWRQSRFGAEAFHSAMLPHAGADTKIFSQVCELGADLATLSAAGVQGSMLCHSDTAILFSAESEWATRCETLPSRDLNHWHEVRDWYRAFLDAGQRVDVVPLHRDWSEYSTIVLPNILVLSDLDVQRLEEFTRSGGTIVAGYATGLVDERFHVGLGGYPGAGKGLLRSIFGVCGEEFNILGEQLEGEPVDIELSNGMSSCFWQNDMKVNEHTEILATYEGHSARSWELDGTPALTRSLYGQGVAYFIGCDLGAADKVSYIGIYLEESNNNAQLMHTQRISEDFVFDFYIARDVSAMSASQDIRITIDSDSDILIAHRAYECENPQSELVDYDSNKVPTTHIYCISSNGILITRKPRS